MPYRFRAGESVPDNVRRIVFEEIDSAIDQLRTKGVKKRDGAIHEARKSIKKMRGILRLMRPELDGVFREENSALRDVGRKLSELRDVGAIIETFDSITRKHEGDLEINGLSQIRKGLERNKREKERSENITRVMAETASSLASVRKRVSDWPLRTEGFAALTDGLRETYRAGRRAMRLAQAKKRPELYHEWRKRAKDHWYHVRLLESSWTEVMQAREASLHDLETWLGDDHNLVVLGEQLQREPERYGSVEDVQLFLTLAQAQRKELHEKAVSLGSRVYEQKPRLFVKSVKALWESWQEQPNSMKREQKAQRKPQKRSAGSARKSAA